MKFKIRNWEKFQHYTDRTPQWVKLHREMLSSEDWVMSNNETRVLMIVLILLAAQQGDDGVIEIRSLEYLKIFGTLKSAPDLQPLVESEFVEVLDGEIETKKKKAKKAKGKPKYTPEFEEFWELYGKLGSKYKAAESWAKLGAEDRDSMIKKTEAYLDRRQRARGFVPTQPMAATYLNQERWHDVFGNQPDPVSTTAGESEGDLLQAERAATRRGIEYERCNREELFAMLDDDIRVMLAFFKSKGISTVGLSVNDMVKAYHKAEGKWPHA